MVLFGRNSRVAGAGASQRRSPVGLLRRGDRGVRGSRSSTARRCTCSPTRTSRTAPSRGCSRTSTTLPDISTTFATEPNGEGEFLPYLRDARDARAAVGDPGHAGPRAPRSAGSRRRTATGNVSYDPDNHDLMTRLRAQKVAGHRRRHPRARGRRPGRRRATCSCSAGAARTARSPPACRRVRAQRAARSRTRTCATSTRSRATLGEVLRRYERVLVPEMNLGQLLKLSAPSSSSTRSATTASAAMPLTRGRGRATRSRRWSSQ